MWNAEWWWVRYIVLLQWWKKSPITVWEHSGLSVAIPSCTHHWWHADYSSSAPQHSSVRCKIPCTLQFLYLKHWEVRNTRKWNVLFKVMLWISVYCCWVCILRSLDSCSTQFKHRSSSKDKIVHDFWFAFSLLVWYHEKKLF